MRLAIKLNQGGLQMALQLTQQLESIVERGMKSGRYSSAEELLSTALLRLEMDTEEEQKSEALVKAVDAGFASGVYEGDPFEAALKAIQRSAASRLTK
jgi:putative addiction module CopG family antidote